jgi:hypothetical protein
MSMNMSVHMDRSDCGSRAFGTVVMVLAFIFFWPLGLAILAYRIGSKRMVCANGSSAWGERCQSRMERKIARFREKMQRWGVRPEAAFGFAPTGNRAFDEYRSETIRRLEDEANEFRDFLDRLRQAKDKAEFDDFMTERRTRPESPQGDHSEPAARQ